MLLASFLFLSSCIRSSDGPIRVTEGVTTSTSEVTNQADTTVPESEKAESGETENNQSENEKKEEAGKPRSASFVGCGDNIIYFGTYRDAASKSDGTRKYNFKPIYKNVQDIISGADIAFINQETACAQSFEPESYPTFNSPVDLTFDIRDVGFDVIGMANNHMLDKGALGLRESFDNWNAVGLTVIGCYEEKDDGTKYITYYEKNDIIIAFVAYTYGTNLSEDPAKEGLYAPYLKQSDVASDMKEARENSDFVIVSVHWGEEGSMTPSTEQVSYAKIMAENGADVILGHHPHVIQPIEWLEGYEGSKTLCAYSLGNFVHEQARDYNVPGGIISFDITDSGDGDVKVVSPRFIPTVCHYPSNFYDNVVYLLEDYTEDLARSHAVRTYYNNTISLEGLKKYVTDTISAEFLPEYLN